jgi:putative PIN family toxin of toxin-antitoxin system
MRVVLDTNVVVSGLLQSQGNPAQVLALALAGAMHVCYDRRILGEYAEVLARPRFQFSQERVREVLTKLELDGIPVQASEERLDLPDPDDEPFLAVALAGSADYLVTGTWRITPRTNGAGAP